MILQAYTYYYYILANIDNSHIDTLLLAIDTFSLIGHMPHCAAPHDEPDSRTAERAYAIELASHYYYLYIIDYTHRDELVPPKYARHYGQPQRIEPASQEYIEELSASQPEAAEEAVASQRPAK